MPRDAAIEIKELSSYVSPIAGGHGAVRDVVEHYLRELGTWGELVDHVYGVGI